MPTYQYACTECSHQFEIVQSFSDDALSHCPECDGRLRKVFNAVGVVFKGSGFYRTDSRDSKSAAAPATTSKSESSTSSSSDSGSTKSSDSAKSDSAKSSSSSSSSTASTSS